MKEFLFKALGFICVGFGAAGIFLPILPTTPFLLLAAWLFIRSSEETYQWLIHHKVFGKYVYHYLKHGAVKMSTKITSVILLWTMLIISMAVTQGLYLKLILAAIGVMVTLHIASLKTFHE